MKEGIINQIKNPHFYEDNAYDNVFTFEDLAYQMLLNSTNEPKMHLWLPASATQEQIDLVKKICGKI